jgi:hypothetical protein
MAHGNTKTFTVTDAADVAIAAETYTSEITVREDAAVVNWPTTDFDVRKPATTSTANRQPTGGSYTFKKGSNSHYQPGETAGYVRLPTGATSTTFQQDEA